MKIRFSFFLAILGVIFISFLSLFVRFVPDYNLEISQNHIVAKSENYFEFSSEKPQNTWYVGIQKTAIGSQNICMNLMVENSRFRECLDNDDVDETSEFYTFPIVTSLTRQISFSFEGNEKLNSVTLYSLNTLSEGKKLAFVLPTTQADEFVISRSEWGADETLRYADHPRHILSQKKYLENQNHPKTEAELKKIQYNSDVHSTLKKSLGNEFETTSLIRTENGHKLIWPIQKVKKVNRIIVHHTAESLDGVRSDAEILRAIYAYHTVTRGWGDIGYNYIIGQRGQIYEGRAGGDYVVGAHALDNNIGSVGISVLGDYSEEAPDVFKEMGLKRAITMVAKKYGITLSQKAKGFKRCNTVLCYPVQIFYTKSLIGHKDVGVTSCPGKHIHGALADYIKELDVSYTPILNTEKGIIEPKNTSENQNLNKKIDIPQNIPSKNIPSSPPKNIAPKISEQNIVSLPVDEELKNTRYFGQKFRVKLSYPNNSITLSAYQNVLGFAYLDYRRKPIYPNNSLTIEPKGNQNLLLKIGDSPYEIKNFSFSAPVVQIDSWNRVPEWDTTKKYNDNLFRDTIEIFNENGKLVIVNHLPLEWYLKGLGEVSNTDLAEKIKTITVAARGYANFYMERENRKYATNRYDGSDNPDSFQKYLGYSYEKRSPNVAKMVDATRGEIIYYNNIAIKPWYFSSSDGRTRSYKEYCLANNGKNCEDIPYLQSVPDPAGKISSGHGVGISGIGATDFAQKGWDYKKIIQYYLPGVSIHK